MSTTVQYVPEDKAQFKGEVTPEQIKAWKAEHELGIFCVKKSGRIGYFKVAGFQEIDAYYGLSKQGVSKVSEEWKSLTGMLWIGGCEELITSPLYLPNVSKYVQQQIAGEEAEMVNL